MTVVQQPHYALVDYWLFVLLDFFSDFIVNMCVYTFHRTFNDVIQVDRAIKDKFSNFVRSECNVTLGDFVVVFKDELTQQDVLSLTDLIANFQEIAVTVENACSNVLTIPYNTSNTDWTLICAWTYPGMYSLNLKNIHIESYLQDGTMNDTYSIRIYDSTNNINICNLTASNSSIEMFDIDCAAEKLPISMASFELHGKVSSPNSKLYIKLVCISS